MNNLTTKQTIAYIGIGSAGEKTIQQLTKNQSLQAAKYLVINGDNNTHDPSISVLYGKLCKSSVLSFLKEETRNIRFAVIVCGLGGEIGSTYSPIAASFFQEQGIPVISSFYMPFEWEGKARNKQALNTKKTLQSLSDGVLVIDNQLPLSPKSRDLSGWFTEKDEKMYAFFSNLENVIQDKDSFTKEDVLSFISC